MPEYTLKVRRYQPEDAERGGPYWEEFTVDLDSTLSVLDGILQAKDRRDGSLAVRCSCKAAICGSCGVKVNGDSTLACLTQLGEAHAEANRRTPPGAEPEPITVEPMGNMPVVKDLVTDMESVHWKKHRRVVPWLIPDPDVKPEREYIVSAEAMIDVTQSVSCIQCGACVSACLSMEADPEFIGPAALAKAYRFVGDPRDSQHAERLYDLAQDPAGIYDCTHCFACIDACPKDVAPMDQIMRLRRVAEHDHDILDQNNGRRHSDAFVKIIRRKGTLDESMLLQESFAPGVIGKLKPPRGAIRAMLTSVPVAVRGVRTGKMRSIPKLIPGLHHKLPGDSMHHVERIYERAEESRIEVNMWVREGQADSDDEESLQAEPAEAGSDERSA